jgi:hypothetical protein
LFASCRRTIKNGTAGVRGAASLGIVENPDASASRPTDLQIGKAKVGASADPERAALYRFLASMIDPCIDSFDEEPLPIHVADKVFGARIVLARSSRQGAQIGCFATGLEIVGHRHMWQNSY